jgi:hypothetical protein
VLRIWHHRVRSLVRKDVVDAEVATEFAFHSIFLSPRISRTGIRPTRRGRRLFAVELTGGQETKSFVFSGNRV